MNKLFLNQSFLIEQFPEVIFSVFFIVIYYFVFKSSLGIIGNFKIQASAFFYGVAAAGLSLAIQIFIKYLEIKENIYTKSFLFSSFTEEFSRAIFIFYLLKNYSMNKLISEGIYLGVVLGGAVGLVENIFYGIDLGFWPLMLRTITSIPVHILNGGILGYYIMLFLFYNPANFRFNQIIKGFIICWLIHGFYNYYAIINKYTLIALPIILIYAFIYLQIIIAASLAMLPKFILDLTGLFLDDYELIRKFRKCEEWYLKKHESRYYDLVSIFRKVEIPQKVNSTIFLIISIIFTLYYFKNDLRVPGFLKNITVYEYLSIFIFYPLFIAVNFLFIGLINPDFFQKKIIKFPLLCRVHLSFLNHSEESYLFFMNKSGFYTPVSDPTVIIDNELLATVTVGEKNFGPIKAKIIWKSEGEDENQRHGVLIGFKKTPFTLLFYWNLIRNIKRIKNSFRPGRSILDLF